MTAPDHASALGTDVAASAEPDLVDVRLPAAVAYVSTLRLVTASLATRCDLTLDEIDDLRLAVDEACALLLPHAGVASTIDARFELTAGRLVVSTSVASTEGEPDRDSIAWTVLGALVSSIDVASRDGRLSITITKTRETSST